MTIYDNKVQILKPSAFDDVELTAGERANAAIFEAEYAEYQAKGGNAQFKVPSIKDIESARVILGRPDNMPRNDIINELGEVSNDM